MFDLAALTEAVAAHGLVARVVIAAHDGSSPREVGASMLVWAGGQSGTIGGGALEWEAARVARGMLGGQPSDPSAPPSGSGPAPSSRGEGGRRASRLDRHALGPSLGQCCGGAVTLLSEVFDAATLPVAVAGVMARPVAGSTPMPLAVRRIIARARGEGAVPAPTLLQGWFIEPLARADRQVWVWGAGHVGRALVAVIAPLQGVEVTWIDVAADRFPDGVPAGVAVRTARSPADLVAEAPAQAEHLVLTYSHALDLDLCHRLLQRGFGSLGLIGSATKWARFRSRLAALGHPPTAIARIECPIGDPGLGKHPQAIAIGVAAALLRRGPRGTRDMPFGAIGGERA